MSKKELFWSIIDKLDLGDKRKDLEMRLLSYKEHNFIDLSELEIKYLPDQIFDGFDNLKHLSLGNNQLSSIDASLFKPLKNLVSLDLSYSLSPEDFDEDELFALEEDVFTNLTNLQLLDLSGNQIEFLPDGILDGLYNLEALNLSYNLLALLPISIGNCINLEELYLEANFLPIEFKEVFEDYLELQDFLAPFQQTWNLMNNPPETAGGNLLMDLESEDRTLSEDEMVINQELRKVFDNLDDI